MYSNRSNIGRGDGGRRGRQQENRGTGRGRGRGGARAEREYFIGYRKLVEFAAKDGDELLHIAVSKNSGIPWLLKQNTVKSDWISLLLTILGKACATVHNPASLISLLTLIRNSTFLKEVLVMYLTEMMQTVDIFKVRQFGEPLKNTFVVLKALLESMPTSVNELVPISSTAELVVRTLRASNHVVDNEIDTKLEKLIQLRGQLLSRRTALHQDGQAEVEEEQPPDNFRELSIFPTTEVYI